MKKSRIEWPVVLFSLPFVLLGAAALLVTLWQIGSHLRSLGWVEHPALLQAAGTSEDKLEETSRREARYTYELNGKTYTGTRIAFSLIRSDGLDDWDERVAEYLGAPGRMIQIWVNPNDPTESVVVRDIRWAEFGAALLFAFGMGAGGLALLVKACSNGPAATPAKPTVKLGTVIACWFFAPLFGTLAWLLWRDGHVVWAVVASLQIVVAINAAVQYAKGLQRSRTPTA